MVVEEQLEVSVESNSGWDSRIRCVKCGDLVRAYLIKTNNFVLVYDTLLGPKSGAFLREQALEMSGSSPLLVVNSHADWDHYFGNMVFPETIMGTQTMIERVTGGVGERELSQKRTEHPDSYRDVRLKAPTVGLGDKTTLYGGDLTVHLLLTTGHRPDHLALYIPEIATLFPGDCVEDPIPLVDEDSEPASRTIEELAQSLQSFLDLRPEWVLANHAPPEGGTQRLVDNLQYLKKLQEIAAQTTSYEELLQQFPADPSWGDFYQRAHQFHARLARQQSRRASQVQWAAD